jgi:hypothetical protein
MRTRGTLYTLVLGIVVAVSGCTGGDEPAEQAPAEQAPAAGSPATTKPKNEYNISINYELGMHCTGFDFSYCCVLPPYNSVQSQVVKTAQSADEKPTVLGADPEDPAVLVDGAKRMKLAYGFVDNTYSEGAKLAYWSVPYDINENGSYEANENVANAYWNHLYIYKDLKGSNPKGTSNDSEKKFVGKDIPVPEDNGPAGAAVPSPMEGGHLHYTGDKGTIVYTKSPVLDNVPIVLTNPGIWDALGLPLTPFTDTTFQKNFITVVESDIRPYQEAWVALVEADSGSPVIDSHTGKPVKFFGTDPIDVPNCANCHSNENANGKRYTLYKPEYAFWRAVGASEWFAKLKATSVSILQIHDAKHGTRFTAKYDPNSRSKTNRLGRDPILCQTCHADNVIAVLQSKGHAEALTGNKVPNDQPLPALTQAIHHAHQKNRPLMDSQGRTGSCQGCHPAHRQDGRMDGYPISPTGENNYADADNRDASGGCYVGRDVHSNPAKDEDGAETPEHLNAIGQWLQANVSQIGNGEGGKGLWCTNCHNQLSRELYQRDQITQAFLQEGETLRNKSLGEIARAIGVSEKDLAEKYMDPKVVPDESGRDTPGESGILLTWAQERLVPDIAVIALKGEGPMVNKDEDGDVNVVPLSANPSVDPESLKLPEAATGATAVPYDAATHGRDYWLAAGAPHCADCHAAPYVEGQGGVAFPINQPGKYSLMRYTKGHAGLACQVCHQSIHGLYPVTSDNDTTTYAQATQYNPDGSHGPIKCAACHVSNTNGVPLIAEGLTYDGESITRNYDAAVSWMHASAPDLGGKIPPVE